MNGWAIAFLFLLILFMSFLCFATKKIEDATDEIKIQNEIIENQSRIIDAKNEVIELLKEAVKYRRNLKGSEDK